MPFLECPRLLGISSALMILEALHKDLSAGGSIGEESVLGECECLRAVLAQSWSAGMKLLPENVEGSAPSLQYVRGKTRSTGSRKNGRTVLCLVARRKWQKSNVLNTEQTSTALMKLQVKGGLLAICIALILRFAVTRPSPLLVEFEHALDISHPRASS